MMIKASEAYETAVKVLTEDASSHIARIEEEIKKSSAKGSFRAVYNSPLSGEDNMAKDIVLKCLTDAGYTYKWSCNTLVIYWENK